MGKLKFEPTAAEIVGTAIMAFIWLWLVFVL